MKTKLFTLVVVLICATQLFAHDFEVGGIYYNILGDDSVAVTYKGNSYNDYANEYSGAITIPATIEHNSAFYRVTAIDKWTFNSCSQLTEVIIPDGVTSIGVTAFFDCYSLSKITLPNSITSISNGAFCGCSNLATITIPNSVIYIGESAFSGCSGLTAPVYNKNLFAYMPTSYSGVYIIPDSIASICGSAFKGCSNLTLITIPNSVTTIGNYAFADCSSLATITVPNSVTSIGDYVFQNCSNLTTITIPESVTYIGESAFKGCSGLTAPVYNKYLFAYMPISYSGVYIIPDGITSICNSAFDNCSSLTNITIPEGVTTIGDYAFQDCSSLTEITIPNSVTSIGHAVFMNCYSLTAPIYNAHIFAFLPTQYSGAYTIPDGITLIAGGAFRFCYSLTDVTIPESVTSIGGFALANCSSLREIRCLALTPPTITQYTFNSNPVVYVCYESEEAYKNAPYWSELNIQSIKEFESSGIYYQHIGSDSVAVIYNPDAYIGVVNIPNKVEKNSTIYHVTTISDSAFYNCSSLTNITIPEGVITIGNSAFYGCSSLTSITIPNSVTTIGNYAFYNCSSLTNITIPEGVITIGNYAFYNCSSLTNITIPEGVITIGNSAFYGCSSLTSITIPNSVTTIGNYAFYGCSNLTTLTWNAKNCTSTPFTDITLQITSIAFGNEVEIIPASLCSGMSGLSTITLYNKVAFIGSSAFKDCTGLRKLTIGSGIEKMGNEAFAGCTGLLTLSIAADIPPLVQINTFQNVSTTAIIKVPCGASELYRAASYWNTFTNCQDGVLFAFSAISADDTKGRVTVIQKPICDNDAVAIFEAVPYNGYKFVSWNDGHTENPRTVDVIEDVEYIATFTVSDVTAVGNIVTDHLSGVKKVFENGTIYILRDGEKYTVDGRKVSTM